MSERNINEVFELAGAIGLEIEKISKKLEGEKTTSAEVNLQPILDELSALKKQISISEQNSQRGAEPEAVDYSKIEEIVKRLKPTVKVEVTPESQAILEENIQACQDIKLSRFDFAPIVKLIGASAWLICGLVAIFYAWGYFSNSAMEKRLRVSYVERNYNLSVEEIIKNEKYFDKLLKSYDRLKTDSLYNAYKSSIEKKLLIDRKTAELDSLKAN